MSLSEIESIKINEEQMLLATSQVIQIKRQSISGDNRDCV